MHAQIQTLSESDNTSLMTKTLDDGYIPFTYNGNEIGIGEEEFLEPGWTVYDFSYNKIVTIEVQIHSRNFKTRSQSLRACDYSFCLQSVYAFLLTPIPNTSKRRIKSHPTFCSLRTKKSKIA